MNTIHQLADAISTERRKRELSPAMLARESGVSRAGLYRFASGGDIRLSTFLALCDQLGMDLVLAPKVVAGSVQEAVNVRLGPLTVSEPLAGPQSAVAARLQKLQKAADGTQAKK